MAEKKNVTYNHETGEYSLLIGMSGNQYVSLTGTKDENDNVLRFTQSVKSGGNNKDVAELDAPVDLAFIPNGRKRGMIPGDVMIDDMTQEKLDAIAQQRMEGRPGGSQEINVNEGNNVMATPPSADDIKKVAEYNKETDSYRIPVIGGRPPKVELEGKLNQTTNTIQFDTVIKNTADEKGQRTELDSPIELPFTYYNHSVGSKTAPVIVTLDSSKQEALENITSGKNTTLEAKNITSEAAGGRMATKTLNIVQTPGTDKISADIGDIMAVPPALGGPEGARLHLVGTVNQNDKLFNRNVTFTGMEMRDRDGKPVTGADGKTITVPGIERFTLQENEGKASMNEELHQKLYQKVVDEGHRKHTEAKAAGAAQQPPAAGAAPGAAAPAGGSGEGENEDEGPMGFLKNNKFAAGALMLGLLAAVMGGGLPALILGLLAMVIASKMIDGEDSVANRMFSDRTPPPNTTTQEGPAQGQGKIPATPGHESAVDVAEGTEVQLVKMDGMKKAYLKSQNAETGALEYGDTPTESLKLRTIKDGKATGIIEGDISADGAAFYVTGSAFALPDGRISRDPTNSNGRVALHSSGKLDLNMADMDMARRDSREAHDAYAKTQDITLEPGADGRVTARLNTVRIGDKDYTAAVSGTLAEGKAVFDKAFAMQGNQVVLGENGKPIELNLPNRTYDVLEGKISPLTGDVKAATDAIIKDVARESGRQMAEKEQTQVSRAKNTVDEVAKANTKDEQRGVLAELISKNLEDLGITDTRERAVMTSSITDKYMDANFRAVGPEQARETIAGMVGTNERIKAEMGDFAARIHEGVSSTIDSKSNDTASVNIAQTGLLARPAFGQAVERTQDNGIG